MYVDSPAFNENWDSEFEFYHFSCLEVWKDIFLFTL